MPGETLFWGIAALVALSSLGLVLAPLLRGTGRGGRRASYDMQVYRDQLREIESDRARGVLTAEESEATRLEISRRLLAAADAETAETAADAAPPGVSRAVAAGLIALLLVAAAGLYVRLGAPGQPDQPLRARLELEAEARAARPRQAAVEVMVANQPRPGDAPAASAGDIALVEQLERILAERPDDLEGHRLLAHNMSTLGRWPEARAAQGEVVRILGPAATAADLVAWAELMVLATHGYVSPEAEAALGRALELDPGNALGRYYSGLTALQAGRPDLTYDLWSRLLAEGPADAPWVVTIAAQIDEVARMAGLPPDAAPAGPSQAEIEAAGALAPEERQSMIDGMIAQLSDRLTSEGGTVAEWAQLIRALGVQGRMDEAAKAWTDAQAASAGDAAALGTLAAAAREAGLAQ